MIVIEIILVLFRTIATLYRIYVTWEETMSERFISHATRNNVYFNIKKKKKSINVPFDHRFRTMDISVVFYEVPY